MKIIVELSLCINLIINAFIIKSTALFFKEKARLWWLSSAIGAVVALVLPLCHVTGVLTVVVEVLLAALLVSISFPFKTFKRFAAFYAVFLGMTFVYGGGCYAMKSAFGDLPLLCVLVVASVIWVASSIVLKSRNRARVIENFSYKVRLKCNGVEVEEEGYLDSGNMLYDPVTGRPVVLITFEVFSKIYGQVNYLSAYMKTLDIKGLCEGHYIKINSVASGTSILVFTAEELEISREEESHKYEKVALGLSFSGFEKAFGKRVLLNSQLL